LLDRYPTQKRGEDLIFYDLHPNEGLQLVRRYPPITGIFLTPRSWKVSFLLRYRPPHAISRRMIITTAITNQNSIVYTGKKEWKIIEYSREVNILHQGQY
jgi:hypothetical protein